MLILYRGAHDVPLLPSGQRERELIFVLNVNKQIFWGEDNFHFTTFTVPREEDVSLSFTLLEFLLMKIFLNRLLLSLLRESGPCRNMKYLWIIVS